MEQEKNIKFGYVLKKPKIDQQYPLGYKPFRDVGKASQLEWLKKTIEYIQLSSIYELRYDLKRGEVYEIDFGVNVNSEFSNRHYAVVLVDSPVLNPLVLVCPLKSNHNGANQRSDVNIGYVNCLGGDKETLAVINQIRTVDKFRILRRNQIGVKRLDMPILERLEEDYEVSSEPTTKRLSDAQLNEINLAYMDFIVNNGVRDKH